jgi:DNA polymerase-3 subunit epsilon
VKVHGLTDEFLADKPLFAEVADDLLVPAGADVVIHNAAFDVGFLNAELKRLGVARCSRRGGQGHRHAADGARDVPRQGQLAGRAVQAAGGGQLQPHAARRAAGRRLLAEVYIRLTRGQDSLVIDRPTKARARPACRGSRRPVGLRAARAAPHAEEAAAHEAVLADLDKASGGKTVWRAAAPA